MLVLHFTHHIKYRLITHKEMSILISILVNEACSGGKLAGQQKSRVSPVVPFTNLCIE